jgi:hypothetical protein
MPRTHLPPLNYEQQVIWKALSLVEESELVGMLRALRHHPDRNLTIDRINEALDQGLDLLGIFHDDYKGLHDLQYDGGLQLDVELGIEGLVFLSIGYDGPKGGVSVFNFTIDADGRIAKVEFEDSHNEFLLYGFFDNTRTLS